MQRGESIGRGAHDAAGFALDWRHRLVTPISGGVDPGDA